MLARGISKSTRNSHNVNAINDNNNTNYNTARGESNTNTLCVRDELAVATKPPDCLFELLSNALLRMNQIENFLHGKEFFVDVAGARHEISLEQRFNAEARYRTIFAQVKDLKEGIVAWPRLSRDDRVSFLLRQFHNLSHASGINTNNTSPKNSSSSSSSNGAANNEEFCTFCYRSTSALTTTKRLYFASSGRLMRDFYVNYCCEEHKQNDAPTIAPILEIIRNSTYLPQQQLQQSQTPRALTPRGSNNNDNNNSTPRPRYNTVETTATTTPNQPEMDLDAVLSDSKRRVLEIIGEYTLKQGDRELLFKSADDWLLAMHNKKKKKQEDAGDDNSNTDEEQPPMSPKIKVFHSNEDDEDAVSSGDIDEITAGTDPNRITSQHFSKLRAESLSDYINLLDNQKSEWLKLMDSVSWEDMNELLSSETYLRSASSTAPKPGFTDNFKLLELVMSLKQLLLQKERELRWKQYEVDATKKMMAEQEERYSEEHKQHHLTISALEENIFVLHQQIEELQSDGGGRQKPRNTRIAPSPPVVSRSTQTASIWQFGGVNLEDIPGKAKLKRERDQLEQQLTKLQSSHLALTQESNARMDHVSRVGKEAVSLLKDLRSETGQLRSMAMLFQVMSKDIIANMTVKIMDLVQQHAAHTKPLENPNDVAIQANTDSRDQCSQVAPVQHSVATQSNIFERINVFEFYRKRHQYYSVQTQKEASSSAATMATATSPTSAKQTKRHHAFFLLKESTNKYEDNFAKVPLNIEGYIRPIRDVNDLFDVKQRIKVYLQDEKRLRQKQNLDNWRFFGHIARLHFLIKRFEDYMHHTENELDLDEEDALQLPIVRRIANDMVLSRYSELINQKMQHLVHCWKLRRDIFASVRAKMQENFAQLVYKLCKLHVHNIKPKPQGIEQELNADSSILSYAIENENNNRSKALRSSNTNSNKRKKNDEYDASFIDHFNKRRSIMLSQGQYMRVEALSPLFAYNFQKMSDVQRANILIDVVEYINFGVDENLRYSLGYDNQYAATQRRRQQQQEEEDSENLQTYLGDEDEDDTIVPESTSSSNSSSSRDDDPNDYNGTTTHQAQAATIRQTAYLLKSRSSSQSDSVDTTSPPTAATSSNLPTAMSTRAATNAGGGFTPRSRYLSASASSLAKKRNNPNVTSLDLDIINQLVLSSNHSSSSSSISKYNLVRRRYYPPSPSPRRSPAALSSSWASASASTPASRSTSPTTSPHRPGAGTTKHKGTPASDAANSSSSNSNSSSNNNNNNSSAVPAPIPSSSPDEEDTNPPPPPPRATMSIPKLNFDRIIIRAPSPPRSQRSTTSFTPTTGGRKLLRASSNNNNGSSDRNNNNNNHNNNYSKIRPYTSRPSSATSRAKATATPTTPMTGSATTIATSTTPRSTAPLSYREQQNQQHKRRNSISSFSSSSNNNNNNKTFSLPIGITAIYSNNAASPAAATEAAAAAMQIDHRASIG